MADDIFEREIRPFLFDGVTEDQTHPKFVQLVGQTGAGRSRALGRLLEERSGQMAVLRAADLTPFLRDSPGTDAIRAWISASLNHAREHRISIILEDSFRATVDLTAPFDFFHAAGFETRVVAVAVPRAESLLALTAQRERQMSFSPAGTPAEVDATLRLATELLMAPPADSAVTIVARDGTVRTPNGAADALAVWREALAAPLSGKVAAEWISELRRLTDASATRRGRPDRAVLDALVELHRVALTEIVPRLPLPAESTARQQLAVRITSDLAVLRRRAETADAAAVPAVAQPEPGRLRR